MLILNEVDNILRIFSKICIKKFRKIWFQFKYASAIEVIPQLSNAYGLIIQEYYNQKVIIECLRPYKVIKIVPKIP